MFLVLFWLLSMCVVNVSSCGSLCVMSMCIVDVLCVLMCVMSFVFGLWLL